MFAEQDQLMHQCLGVLYGSLKDISAPASTPDQLEKTVATMNDAKGHLLPEWRKAFADLGGHAEVQQIFMDDAKSSVPAVDVLANWIAVNSVPTLREWCLAFDYVTQNGGFHPAFRAAISTFLLAMKPFQKDPQKDRLRAICWFRGGWTYIKGNRPFADDVLHRKLLIVEGRGKFRNELVDLDEKFEITDESIG
jgi:hypothetical protein